MVNDDKNASGTVVAVDCNDKAKKPSFAASNTNSSEKVAEEERNDSKKVGAVTSVASVVATSTDTTLSTITTKIEDQQNEMEILLLELHDSSDIGAAKDDDSVSSSTSSIVSRYFVKEDFLPWEDLYSKAEYAPHVGFAMVAGGFACMHPILFFAGVVTAVGAVRAAGATYEYAMCMQQSRRKGIEGDDSDVDDLVIPCDCFPTALRFSNSTNIEAEKVEPTTHSKLGDTDSIPPMAKSCSTVSTNASTLGELSVDASAKAEIVHMPSSTVPSVIKSPRRVRWVADNFPVLPIVALENVEFRGLNAHEFFDVFFADDAPFGFPAFHILRRDKEVQYSPWNTIVPSDKPNSDSLDFPPSVVAKEREVQYHAKTNSFLGPAYAPTKKTQRAYFVSKKMLVIDIRMTLHDIPFSKQFYLVERWVIDGTRGASEKAFSKNTKKNKKQQPHYNNGNNSTRASSSHGVYLTVSSEVYFTQDCSFESAVRKESTKQVCEISKCWNAMAQASLKVTEETRMKRLRQQDEEKERESGNKLDNIESIEIEHVENSNHRNNRNRGRRRRSSIRNRRRSSSILQDELPEQSDRPLQGRRLSQSFSKLLARGSNPIKTRERRQKFLKAPLKVRISSAGETNY